MIKDINQIAEWVRDNFVKVVSSNSRATKTATTKTLSKKHSSEWMNSWRRRWSRKNSRSTPSTKTARAACPALPASRWAPTPTSPTRSDALPECVSSRPRKWFAPTPVTREQCWAERELHMKWAKTTSQTIQRRRSASPRQAA